MSRPTSALVADVGGTYVRFALAAPSGGPLLAASVRQLSVAGHPSLVDAANDYLAGLPAGSPTPAAAVFAIAGRVDGRRASMTNHPWQVDADSCAAALGIHRVALINDFTAQALAVPHLDDGERVALGGARATASGGDATFAVLGPGTGLGVSALLRRDGRQFALASEGGHAAFAPKTPRQRAVLDLLAGRWPRVSYERLLSGSGLSNLCWALTAINGNAPVDWRPDEVTAAARAGEAIAVEAVQLFCEVLGAFAGDLVLTFGAWDGVYLSGGLIPRLLDDLHGPGFRAAFENKGRFSEALAAVPVHAVTHPQAGLLGAAALALDLDLASARGAAAAIAGH